VRIISNRGANYEKNHCENNIGFNTVIALATTRPSDGTDTGHDLTGSGVPIKEVMTCILAFLSLCGTGFGKTRQCGNLDYATVNNAVNGMGTPTAPVTSDQVGDCPGGACSTPANAGDIVMLPSGTPITNWTNTLNITKNITLTGPVAPLGAPTAKIIGSDATSWNGQLIAWTTDGGTNGVAVDETAKLLNVELRYPSVGGNGNASTMLLKGTARFHYDAQGSPAGGVRLYNVRFAVTDAMHGLGLSLDMQDWISGVIDHCWWDYSALTANSQSHGACIHIGTHASAPGFVYGTSPVTIHGQSIRPDSGFYSYSVSHLWGGSFGRADPNGVGGLSEDDVIVIEDCILEAKGIVTSLPDAGGLTRGGCRVVYRHNSSWGNVGTHGFGETGGDCGNFALESYNNVYALPDAYSTSSIQVHNIRAGGAVYFNERYQHMAPFPTKPFGATFNRFGFPSLNMIGAADGTNFFDKNHRGALGPLNGINYSPLTDDPFNPGHAYASDGRIGSVYFTGNTSSNWAQDGTGVHVTLNAPNGSSWNGVQQDQFVGWTIRNRTYSPPETDGSQTEPPIYPGTGDQIQHSGVITGNTMVGDPAAGPGKIRVDVAGSAQAEGVKRFALDPGDIWEFRYIDEAVGMPGSGAVHARFTGGNHTNENTLGAPAYVNPVTFRGNTYATNPIQAWAGQDGEGLWAWSNMYRQTSTGAWSASEPNINSPFNRLCPGGMHNSTDGPKPNYPALPQLTVANARIGADWGTGTFGGPTSYPPDCSTGLSPCDGNPSEGATNGWGASYPHPLTLSCATPGDTAGTGGTVGIALANQSSRQYLATRFTPSAGFENVCRLDASLYKTGSPTGTLTAYIYTDSGSGPGSVLANSNGVDASTITATTNSGALAALTTFNFTSSTTLSTSSTYYIVIGNSGNNTTNYLNWSTQTLGGTSFPSYRSSNGSVWTSLGVNQKLYFKTYH